MSKFRIIKSRHLLLPSPVGELACAIHATLDVWGTPVDVLVSHNGQEEDERDRLLQSKTLATVMRTTAQAYNKLHYKNGPKQEDNPDVPPHPFVFLGYVVTKPYDLLHNILRYEGFEMQDIDPQDKDRWCQYILYRGVQRIAYARVSHGDITDTEIQLGRFKLYSDWPAFYAAQRWDEEVEESQVAPQWRFPDAFKGEGWNGHRYHVQDVKYFD